MVSTKCMLGELEIVDIKDGIREDHNRLHHPVLTTHQARSKRKSLLKRISSHAGIRYRFIQCQYKGIITNLIGILQKAGTQRGEHNALFGCKIDANKRKNILSKRVRQDVFMISA